MNKRVNLAHMFYLTEFNREKKSRITILGSFLLSWLARGKIALTHIYIERKKEERKNKEMKVRIYDNSIKIESNTTLILLLSTYIDRSDVKRNE